MRLLVKSATYKLFDVSITIPIGTLNVASAPVPFALPAVEEPARVVTRPFGVILRIRLPLASVTYTLPLESSVMP